MLDALNRRVQLAEADEEKRQEALQQRRAGSHKWLARTPQSYGPTSPLASVHASSMCQKPLVCTIGDGYSLVLLLYRQLKGA